MSATKFWRITRPRPTVWQLGLAAPPDNRLSPDIFRRLLNDLDEVEAEWRTGNRGVTDPKQRQGGALVIHSEIPKFFSNGLDDPERLKVPDFVLNMFGQVNYRLLTFPLVTVAAVNGHAFAGGMFLAMACDYRLASNAFHMWCLPEIALGLPIPTEGLAMFKAKLTPSVLQETVIGKRWKGQELVDSGIAHELVDADKLVERAVTLGEEKAPAAAQGVWGTIKESMYVDVAEHLARRRMIPYPDVEDRAFQFRMERMGKCPERGTVNGKE